MVNLDADVAPVRDTNRFTWWAQHSKAGDLQHWCEQQQHGATGTQLSGAHAVTGLLSFSHSVINTGNSHFLNWLDLEIISVSLLGFHHETRTCNRTSPSLGFFSSLLSLWTFSLPEPFCKGIRWLHLWCLDLCLCFFVVKPVLGALTSFSLSSVLILLPKKCPSSKILHFKEKNANSKKKRQVFDKIYMFRLCFPFERLIRPSRKNILILNNFRITAFRIGQKLLWIKPFIYNSCINGAEVKFH